MITDDLAGLLRAAVLAARDAGEFELADESFAIAFETPRNKAHGDFSSNIALTLKRLTGIPDSRAIAARIVLHLSSANPFVERVEVAGPGFLNFYLKPDWLYQNLVQIAREDTCYGKKARRPGDRILIEFVSANPTGPISVVNGRAAVLGDVLGNLLAAQGWEVGREFYINDALNSTQLDKYARTVEVRYLQQLGHPLRMESDDPEGERVEPGAPGRGEVGTAPIPFPKDGYRGAYVSDIAARIVAEIGDRYEQDILTELRTGVSTPEAAHRAAYFRQTTLQHTLAGQQEAMEAFGVVYDRWFVESSLYESGEVDRAIETVRRRGFTYEKDGALWLLTTAFGDEKDRVLIRSNEKATYVAADIAYHANKFHRGHTRLINILGADHHGYVARLKAGVGAYGFDPDRLDVILHQMVSLMRDGEVVMGGKRKGVVLELKEDLIDEIGKDAARFYFLLNSYDTPATVDVELAKKQSNENPVYYVQYAHARLCNILRRAVEACTELQDAGTLDLSHLNHPSELDVLRKLHAYPGEVEAATTDYAPHRLTRYAMDLAGLLNVFYENCRVLPGKDSPLPEPVTAARLVLVNGARIVMGNLLALLGVSAPEKM